MENILFSYIKMRKVTEGIHLTVADQVLSLRSSGDNPHAEAKDVTMTYEQTFAGAPSFHSEEDPASKLIENT